MFDEKMLQGVKDCLNKIDVLKSDADLDKMLAQYGVDITKLSHDEIVAMIVRYLLSDQERIYYNQYINYKRKQDFEKLDAALTSLGELTVNVSNLYDERREAARRITHIEELIRSLKSKLRDVPTIKISTLYNHLENDYKRYSKKVIKAGMKESQLNDQIHSIERSNFILRGIKGKELAFLKEELRTFKETSREEIDERQEKYNRTKEEYVELLRSVISELLRDDMILNAMLLTCKVLYGVEVNSEFDYRGIERVKVSELKEFNVNIIIEKFFNYYDEHNGEKYDAHTFYGIVEEFVLYFYRLGISKLEGQRNRCLSDISSAFIAQSELISGVKECKTSLTEGVTSPDEDDTLSLVYGMQNK